MEAWAKSHFALEMNGVIYWRSLCEKQVGVPLVVRNAWLKARQQPLMNPNWICAYLSNIHQQTNLTKVGVIAFLILINWCEKVGRHGRWAPSSIYNLQCCFARHSRTSRRLNTATDRLLRERPSKLYFETSSAVNKVVMYSLLVYVSKRCTLSGCR